MESDLQTYATAIDLSLAHTGEQQKPGDIIAKKVSGTVKWYHILTGYGFIIRNDTKEHIFVHKNAIVKYPPPNGPEGPFGRKQAVEFDVVVAENGRHVAANVTGPNGAPVKGSPFYVRLPRDQRR